ncbi:hypothetical protein Hte_000233 [Hypoxylon texense]
MTQLYHKLEDGHFRLLSLDDSTGTVCRLNDYEIDRAPPYIALSYTWGAATYQEGEARQATYHISVNGEQVEADVEERNAQVRKMKAIFEKADHIFAWLGLPHDKHETRLAIKLMRMFCIYLDFSVTKHNGDMGVVRANLSASPVLWPGSVNIEIRKAWQGISKIFNRPYWQRSWIYQEVTTPTDIRFWCGQHDFDDRSFSATLIFSDTFVNIAGSQIWLDAVFEIIDVGPMWIGRRTRIATGCRKLINLLFDARQTVCSDPRDKVYALLGHATDVTPDQLPIDYNKSLAGVYADVVKSYIFHKDNPTLDILGYVYTPTDDIVWNDPLPSWIPDWRMPFSIFPVHQGPSDGAGASFPYDPCPGTTIEAHVTDDTLELRGIVMENLAIDILTAQWKCDTVSEYTNLSTPRHWYDAFFGSWYPALDAAIRRALVGSIISAVPDDQNADHVQETQMVDWDLIDMDSAQINQLGYGTKKENMLMAVRRVCFCRWMAMLTDGTIAIVPGASRSGDQITLFHGGKALYVLRPIPERQNTFRFIGDCYVDGLMDGALMELNAQNGETASLVRMV